VSIQAVEALPHVDRAQRHEDPGRRRDAQHALPRSSSTRPRIDSSSRRRIVNPSRPTSSTAHVVAGKGEKGGEILTSLKTTGDSELRSLRASANHRVRLESENPCRRAKSRCVRPLFSNCLAICARSEELRWPGCRGVCSCLMIAAYRRLASVARCASLNAYETSTTARNSAHLQA
jgi:hypothetical protein